MLHIIFMVGLAPLCALIDRIRGGLFPTGIKATYWIWPLVGLLAYAAGASWQASIAWAIGFLLWVLPAWTVLLATAVGAAIPADQVTSSSIDARIEQTLSFGHPVFGCYVRALLPLIPLGIALLLLGAPVWPLAVIVACFYPAYLIGFHFRPLDMSSIAEWLVGASWGTAILLTLV